MEKRVKIPEATIERIALYYRILEDLLSRGVEVVSSEKFASICRINPAQVRKDLSFFGEFGVRGVGYNVSDLLMEMKKILVSDREWKLGIVGMGNLGMALVRDENFFKRGYRIVAAFDSDPEKVGQEVVKGLVTQPMTEIADATLQLGIEIGVICTPPLHAQRVADLLLDAGIMAILNFSAIQLRKPECCLVQNVDFTVNLDNLAYHLKKSD
jgi:redox-sensing transcriptional repressor